MPRPRFNFCEEPLHLDAEARSSAPGQFAALPDGTVHYEMAGSSDAQTVVLVHGFSTPYSIWDHSFDALAEAGFRVLRYDLYGRGYSDRPDTVYDAELFDRQLMNLLTALNVDQSVDLIGFSMGGAIAVIFTDRRPAMVRKLGLIDPAGFPPRRSFVTRLGKAPILGELLICLHYRPKRFQEELRVQMQYKGFKRALLSTVRHGPLGDLSETYKRVGEQERPALLIWGREDQAIPIDTNKKVRETIPHIEFHAIDGAGHAPHQDRPEEVNPLLIAFLKK